MMLSIKIYGFKRTACRICFNGNWFRIICCNLIEATAFSSNLYRIKVCNILSVSIISSKEEEHVIKSWTTSLISHHVVDCKLIAWIPYCVVFADIFITALYVSNCWSCIIYGNCVCSGEGLWSSTITAVHILCCNRISCTGARIYLDVNLVCILVTSGIILIIFYLCPVWCRIFFKPLLDCNCISIDSRFIKDIDNEPPVSLKEHSGFVGACCIWCHGSNI